MSSPQANFDVAVWEDGGATISCVVRDYTGKLLLAAGKKVDCIGAFEAECRAARETLCLLQAQFYNEGVWIEGDALSVIEEMIASKPQSNPSVLLEDSRLFGAK